LEKLPTVKRVFPSDANFLLIEINNATDIYKKLIKKGVVVRNRSGLLHCYSCLRITIGTPEENERLLLELRNLTPLQASTTEVLLASTPEVSKLKIKKIN